MPNQRGHPKRRLLKVTATAFSWLSVGVFAEEWFGEFIISYEQIAEEEGEEAAIAWALQELSQAIGATSSRRIQLALRFLKAIVRAYRLIN